MKISELFNSQRVVYSFEIFPPKPTSPISVVYNALERIPQLAPHYISVTYGASGNGNSNKTCELAGFIADTFHIPSIAHLTCLHSTKQQVLETIAEMEERGVENVLALRGDKVDGMDCPGEFAYASELVTFIRENSDLCIGAACYPEGHSECSSLEEDVDHLKHKVDCGAQFLTTQLFFDNEDYYRFWNLCEQKGIHVPISCGIMPVTSEKQIERTFKLSGSKVPQRMTYLSRYEGDPDGFYKAGIEYATGQILHLLEHGVRGIHLYTMNSAKVATAISGVIQPVMDQMNV